MMTFFRLGLSRQPKISRLSSLTLRPFLFAFTIGFLLLSFIPAFAQQHNPLDLKLIANLQLESPINASWLDIIANPRNKQQYYVINSQGQLYLVDQQEIQQPAIFDLAAINKLAGSDEQLTLTAIALHPNFAFREQPGFATFYTAHVSKIASSSKTNRLEDKNHREQYRFDAVLTEWQLNQTSLKNTELASQRELVRISLLNNENHINQIDFNPYSKSWNDNYGLLYFSLKTEEALQDSPIYSGTIFRINPNKFGRRAYTSPSNNPYIKDKDIADEIFLLGAQKIEAFLWPEKNSDHLLLSHFTSGKHLLSLSGQKNDWRTKNANRFYVNNLAKKPVLMYQGRKLFDLRNSLLFLSKENNQWQLNSLNYDSSLKTLVPTESTETQTNAIDVWPINNNIISDTSALKLFIGQQNELIIIDQNSHYTYGFKTQKNSSASIEKPTEFIEQESYAGKVIFLAVIAVLGILVIYFAIKISKKTLTSKLGNTYSRFELTQSKKQVGLYFRRQTTTETVITLSDLLVSEIHLNNNVIGCINHHTVNGKGHGFSEAEEADLRQYFADEHKEKMVDEKTRQISLVLTDSKEQYVIVLYSRKGNQRSTKMHYKEVLEELIDWCWLVAKEINAENTGERIIKVVNKNEDAAAHKLNKPVSKLKKSAVIPQEKIEVIAPTAPLQIDQETNDRKTNSENSLIDTELVNALEKLVKLRQQGFLTEEEFTLAKHKLLDDLIK